MRRFALCPTTVHLTELGVTPVCSGEWRVRWPTKQRRPARGWRHAFASSTRRIAPLRKIEPSAIPKWAVNVANQRRETVRLIRRAVDRAAGTEGKPSAQKEALRRGQRGSTSWARLLAQLLKELLTHGGVPFGLLRPTLLLRLMRPLETLPDHAEDALPAVGFHVGTPANCGCQLGRGSLEVTIESRC